MNLILRIPDDVASRIAAQGGDLERRALEALVLEEFRAGRMNKGELRRTLGFVVLNEVDGFLKAHDVFEDYTIADLDRETQALDRLGI
jgi:Uncharacterised protein family (UPF0175)